MAQEITLAIAALAGLGSFLAPCILPVIPAFLAYISGTTITELTRNNGTINLTSTNRANVMLNTVFFVLGFSVVFATLGVLINSLFSGLSSSVVTSFNQIGGAIIIAFGIFMILSTKMRRLNFEKKFIPQNAKASYPLSFVFGLAFAAGWTPCVGPVLGSILTLAATAPSDAFNLLLVYSLGLGIPFLLMGAFISKSTRIVKAFSKHLKYYSVIFGGLIVLLGVLVFTNQLAYLANFPLLNELLLLS